MTEALLSTYGLTKDFPPRRDGHAGAHGRSLQALVDVSIEITAQQSVAIVGESGSGKSTLARILARLIPPTSGRVEFEGTNIFDLSDEQVRSTFRRAVRMIFQDPDAALNPAYPVGLGLERAIRLHDASKSIDARAAALDALRDVDLDPSFMDKFPDELSGGEKRRLGICRALLTKPRMVIADEPLSGLDVLLQERVLGLLKAKQKDRGFALILISHDLDRVVQACDRVLVMREGRVVEDAPIRRESNRAILTLRHPYGSALQSARPSSAPACTKSVIDDDERSDHSCVFAKHCPTRLEKGNPAICASAPPPLIEIAANHWVACHFVQSAPGGALVQGIEAKPTVDAWLPASARL